MVSSLVRLTLPLANSAARMRRPRGFADRNLARIVVKSMKSFLALCEEGLRIGNKNCGASEPNGPQFFSFAKKK